MGRIISDKTKQKEYYGKHYQEKLGYKLPTYGEKHYKFNFAQDHEVMLIDSYVYTEDNFEELREKIYLATNIETYNQHLFYYDNDQIRTTYNIKLNNMFYTVNITKIFNETNQRSLNIDGALIDKKFVSGSVKIEPNDMFRLVADIDNNEIFIKDLQDYDIDKSIVDDDYKFNFYYTLDLFKNTFPDSHMIVIVLILRIKVVYQLFIQN